jgi:hypothetical protein
MVAPFEVCYLLGHVVEKALVILNGGYYPHYPISSSAFSAQFQSINSSFREISSE